MGRFFIVEYDTNEIILMCSVCHIHIALITNLFPTQDLIIWPVSEGHVFSSTVNLLDYHDQVTDDDLENNPMTAVRVYCVQCASFMGYTQYFFLRSIQAISYSHFLGKVGSFECGICMIDMSNGAWEN